MDTPLSQYAKIQPMVQQDARDIATQVYNDLGTQYGVPETPQHEHNGTDSPQVPFANLVGKTLYIHWTIPGTSAATIANYSVFWTAPVASVVTAMTEVHQTAGTDGSAVGLQLEKLTGTTAPGSGTVMLSAALSLKAAINTVQNGSLVPAIGTRQLAVGDRLALKLTGTPTAVANVTVMITIQF